MATPIINHPEVAILGVGKAVKRPVFDPAGNVKPAEMVYLSLSFDHRVVDGAVGAVFGNALIRQLQNPARLLLPGRVAALVQTRIPNTSSSLVEASLAKMNVHGSADATPPSER